MAYNKSLDLIALAVAAAAQGKSETAAKFFTQATKHESVKAAITLINSFNKKEIAKVRASTPANRVKASKAWPWTETASENPDFTQNEDLDAEPDENDGLRVVQEAEFTPEEDEDDETAELSGDLEDMGLLEKKGGEEEARFQRALTNVMGNRRVTKR